MMKLHVTQFPRGNHGLVNLKDQPVIELLVGISHRDLSSLRNPLSTENIPRVHSPHVPSQVEHHAHVRTLELGEQFQGRNELDVELWEVSNPPKPLLFPSESHHLHFPLVGNIQPLVFPPHDRPVPPEAKALLKRL